MSDAEPQTSVDSSSSRAILGLNWQTPFYLLTLLASVLLWFRAIHAPLRLDETGSIWVISDGFAKIWSRQFNLSPAWFYLLWFWTRLFGTSEFALRLFSFIPILGAVGMLYLTAQKLFAGSRSTALIAVIVFCVHPIIIFEAVDIRPYAFVALFTCLSIYLLLRLYQSNSLWLAALFGLTAALTIWLHYFAIFTLPALLICFFLIKSGGRRKLWSQFAVAVAAFILGLLPVIPGFLFVARTSKSHVYTSAPTFHDLFWTLAPRWLPILTIGFVLAAIVVMALKPCPQDAPDDPQSLSSSQQALICSLLGVLTIVIPYTISVSTSVHCFVPRYRLFALPGIALCWAWLVSRARPPVLRLLFCIALVVLTVHQYLISPKTKEHGQTWKYALQILETQAAPSHSPVIMCSDFIESDFATLPTEPANNSIFLSPLSYYKLTVPAYALPLTFNMQTIQLGSVFLQRVRVRHEQFFAAANEASYPTLDWLTRQAASDYAATDFGIYDKVKVLKFTPRVAASTSSEERTPLSGPSPIRQMRSLYHQ